MIFTVILVTIFSILNSGCAGSGGGAAAVQATPISGVTPTPTPVSVTPTPTPSPPFQLTYFSEIAQDTSNTIPATLIGHCTEYNSKVYCWDNGPQHVNSNTCRTFWSVYDSPTIQYGVGCTGDAFAKPTLANAVSSQYSGWFGEAYDSNGPQQIMFNQPNPTTNICSVSGTTLTCTDFIVDLDQTPFQN